MERHQISIKSGACHSRIIRIQVNANSPQPYWIARKGHESPDPAAITVYAIGIQQS
jgi:hypothetical protein